MSQRLNDLETLCNLGGNLGPLDVTLVKLGGPLGTIRVVCFHDELGIILECLTSTF